MNTEDAVPSTLPDEGLNLYAELRRYKEWLIGQALIRTRGNRARAARLLGIKRTTLVMMLKENPLGSYQWVPHSADGPE